MPDLLEITRGSFRGLQGIWGFRGLRVLVFLGSGFLWVLFAFLGAVQGLVGVCSSLSFGGVRVFVGFWVFGFCLCVGVDLRFQVTGGSGASI